MTELDRTDTMWRAAYAELLAHYASFVDKLGVSCMPAAEYTAAQQVIARGLVIAGAVQNAG